MKWKYVFKQDSGDWPFKCVCDEPYGEYMDKREQIVDWCVDTFPHKSWFISGRSFFFTERGYAEMFLLRWS